jgi:hypothetical protein
MGLFDYIKLLFGSDQQWDGVSNYDKSKNSFMTNRFMSIKFPVQANLFNGLRTDPVGQAESWRLVARKFNRVPGFIYTKVSNKGKKQKEWSPDPKALEFYLKVNEIGMREFNEALKCDRDLVISTIDRLKSQITDDRDL